MNKIFICAPEEIVWQTKPADHDLRSIMPAIWRIRTVDFTSFIPNFYNMLSAAEKQKANRFLQLKDQQKAVVGKAVLRILLGSYLKILPEEITFKTGFNKKPLIENLMPEPLFFNVSHAGEWILISVNSTEIGVDVEQMEAAFNNQHVLDFSFSEQEKAFIRQSAKPARTFYELWTRKEALLKATGQGLIDDLPLIPSLNGNHPKPQVIGGPQQNWQVITFSVDENHAASAAFMPVKTASGFFNFQL